VKFLPLLLFLAADAPRVEAPVYEQAGSNMFRRAGAYQYDEADGLMVLFCISEPERVMLHCVVRTENDRLLVIDLVPTEHRT
jgi:hypothetical protein